MVGALSVTAVAALVYVIVGFAWQGVAGRPDHGLMVAGKTWGWIAAEPFFLRGLRPDLFPAALAALLQMFSVALAERCCSWPLAVSSADRWRLGAICASTALLAGWTYPLFAHWVWGGGWLAQLGVNCGLAGLCGWRRVKHNSGGGWSYGVVDHMDSGAAARKILGRGNAGRASRTQRGAGSSGMRIRVAGEIALKAPEQDGRRKHRRILIARWQLREQQAKSWELRSAMSMARLWRDQGRQDDALALLARSGLWLVHRRLRHPRSDGGQGLAR